MRWQWHQLDHMQIICTSRQTDNHANISPLIFFTRRVPFLPPNEQCKSPEGIVIQTVLHKPTPSPLVLRASGNLLVSYVLTRNLPVTYHQ